MTPEFKEEKVVTDGGLFISCLPSGAGIKPALSAARFAAGVPEKISGVYFAKSIGTYFMFADGNVYFSENNVKFVRIASCPEGAFAFEYVYEGKPCAVVCTGSAAVRYRPEKFSFVPVNAEIRAGAYHCGRLFAVSSDDGYKLMWSGAGGFTDWSHGADKGGYLRLDPERGQALNVISFGGKLAVVREYGLTVLNMFGSPENYAVGLTDTSCEKIYKDTAVVCGGRLLFFTRSGLCSFDGSRITRLPHRYSCDITEGKCAAEYGGKYFLACKSAALGGDAALCYDPNDGESYLIDCAAEALCASDGLYVYGGGEVKKLAEGGWEYTSEPLGFGTPKNKTLTEITFKGGADISVSCGGKTRVFAGADGLVRPRMRGKSFTVGISGSGVAESITAKAEVGVGI